MYEIQRFEKYENKKPSKIKGLFRGLLFISLVLFTLNVLISNYLGKTAKNSNIILSPLSTVGQVIHKTSFILKSQENSEQIEKIVLNVLKDSKQYSVVIKNLESGERYYLNEEKQYETASFYKLWVMATAYKQIEEGILSKENVLTANVTDLNDKFNISTESAELTEGSVSWSVEDALKNMITVSDNYSALLLSSKVRLKNVTTFLEKNGFKNSKVGTLETNPISNAKDISLFFEKLYMGDLASEESTSEMLIFLKNQKINTKLSKYLPENSVIGHKTGELGKLSHDAGIVFLDKNDYIIVIMSKTDSPLVANDNIANISKELYKYFTK